MVWVKEKQQHEHFSFSHCIYITYHERGALAQYTARLASTSKLSNVEPG